MEEHRVEKHLYERRYQTATNEWSRSYYVRLKDWKGVRRVWPAGNNLKTARAKRAEYEHRNALKEDFDRDKIKGLTFAKWAATYLEKYAQHKRSVAEDRRHVEALSACFGNLALTDFTRRSFSFDDRVASYCFGNLALTDFTRAHVEAFKQVRKERLSYKGTPVSDAYCNRELATLRHMLRLAVEEGIIASAPIVRLHKEEGGRERTLSPEEYQRLLAVAPVHLRRIITCAYETGMRAGEIKKLSWDKVDFKTGFIRLAADDTKTSEKRAIPISATLRETLEEIRKEQREGKVAPIGGHVFTWGGRVMSEGWKRAFHTACQKAELDGFRFHDLRHTFVTRKVREGWDYKRIMSISGHKTFAVFQWYNNPSEDDLKEVVAGAPPVMLQRGSR